MPTETAPRPSGSLVKRLLLGRAFSSAQLEHTLLPKILALRVFASDALMAIVVLPYRQTVRAYPSGGGACIVSKDNLGPSPGLCS